MEGQQPGSGEAECSRRQRRTGSTPRSRLPARNPPAGEAANPPDDYRGSNQEIWHPPPSLCHSGRYSGAHGASKRASFALALKCLLFFIFPAHGARILPSVASRATKNRAVFLDQCAFGSQIACNPSGLVYKTNKSENAAEYFMF